MRLFERRQPVIMTDVLQALASLCDIHDVVVVVLAEDVVDDVLGVRLWGPLACEAEPPVVPKAAALTGGRCFIVVPRALAAATSQHRVALQGVRLARPSNIQGDALGI